MNKMSQSIKLLLAEKPSQAMDIAKIMGLKSRGDGFVITKDDTYVSWSVGHMIGLKEPDEYDEKWAGRWTFDTLPAIPVAFTYKENSATKKQLKIVGSLIKKASEVIIATDAGREGELIARELLDYFKYKGKVKRFWTSSLTDEAIKDALKNLKEGHETLPLYEAALARAHGDWLIGKNGSRAATLAAGTGDTFPLGRVKTAVLYMIVERFEKIKNFEPVSYFELEAVVKTKKGETFKMVHSPDANNRILSRDKAEELLSKVKGYSGPLSVTKSEDKETPPLPFSLPSLQSEANKVLGIGVKNVLKIAQVLYDKKIISYPRTDCPYLDPELLKGLDFTLKGAESLFPKAVAFLRSKKIIQRPSVFDKSKLTDHHGIVPVGMPTEDLDPQQKQVYELICKRYFQVLLSDCKFYSTKVVLDANGVTFKASGKSIIERGWRELSDYF